MSWLHSKKNIPNIGDVITKVEFLQKAESIRLTFNNDKTVTLYVDREVLNTLEDSWEILWIL